jgi:hypothetical protein
MIPDSLAKAFKNKTLIPIVGAGVSMAATAPDGSRLFPNWTGLLEIGAERLDKENKRDLATAARAMLAIGHYKVAAELLRKGLAGNLWKRFFRDVFAVSPDAISHDSLALARAIWGLSNRVITLNYDKILRYACPSQGVAEIDNTSTVELADFEIFETPTDYIIWHLHGKLDNINELILTTESYDKLYIEENEDYKAAMAILSSVSRKQNLIFVGCSLDDAELLEKIEEQHKIFGGATGPHYALVREQDAPIIRSKLRNFHIDIITFEQFGEPLIAVLQEIGNAKDSPLASVRASISANISPIKIESRKSKSVAVLSANPINRRYDYDDLMKETCRLKCQVNYFPLNSTALYGLTDFNYVIIFSKIVKNEIVIENQDLTAGRLSFLELENSLGSHNLDGLFIFLDHNDEKDLNNLNLDELTLPTVIIPQQKKDQISSLTFKIFKRKNINLIERCKVINPERLHLSELSGEYDPKKSKTLLSENIDAHASNSYIGRVTDLETICRKIFQAKEKNQIVTIKGAGGIGKTLTVKKLAVEFSQRNFFRKGINLVDCEAITSFEVFQYQVARIFNLEEAPDLRKLLSESYSKRDCLIILDNVETLLYLDDCERILSLIDFVCDHATVVATSREILGINSEDVYELRRFTSDEAYELFLSGMPGRNPSEKEKRFIRDEILDTLLDNNPLAIKLITQNTPRNKDWSALKTELDSDFFRKVSDAEIEVFDDESDLNIERKKSLYASINYSYQRLTDEEKAAFEILSLFPDGINLENLKLLSRLAKTATSRGNISKRRDFVITDPIVKGLERKSMIQVDNQMIRLQSIVRKFSEHKLIHRPKSEKLRYFSRAYHYNQQFADALADLRNENQYGAIKTFSNQQNNFLKCISFTDIKAVAEIDFLSYLSTLGTLFAEICASRTFGLALQSIDTPYSDIPENSLCFDLIKIYNQYYEGNFDESFFTLQQLLPLSEMEKMELDSDVNKMIVGHATSIYSMEGFALETAEFDARGRYILSRYSYSLFCIGEIDEKLLALSPKSFFTLEMMRALGKLTVEYIDDYIDSVYEGSHIELMQSYYAKAKLTEVSKEVLESLVAVNPFTAGLKDLMLAFVETDNKSKAEIFERALTNLNHIKYYYVEALYFYAVFLSNVENHSEYDRVHGLATQLAEQYHYRYLQHILKNIKCESCKTYDRRDYPLMSKVDFDGYISFLIEQKIRQGRRARH